MNLRYEIKRLQAVVDKAKPGENVTPEDYELMVSTLKMAKNMQRLRCGAMTISGAIILTIAAGFAVIYGYDADLGQKIQKWSVPVCLGGLVAANVMGRRFLRNFDETKKKIKQLENSHISRMFR